MPHLLYVSATKKAAPFPSIGAALSQAIAGDTVLVGPGRYSPSETQERFPLYVPPGVTLAGAGQGESVLDGQGAMELSFRPVREEQSLLLLGHGSTLTGFSVVNGGGNGVANQPGASGLILRNEIRGHGQHGVLVSGPQELVLKDNIFLDNGTKRFSPTTPRGTPARQGHHVFIQARGGAANRVIIADNSMTRAYADGVAMVVFFDEPDGVVMHVSLINNLIEQNERRGLTIAGSFSASRTHATIEVRRNVIRDNVEGGIVAQVARPLQTILIRDSYLRLDIHDNECRNNGEGIALYGGFGPAEGNLLDGAIVGNLIAGTKRHAVRIIGGVGFRGHAARHNRVRVAVSRNRVEDAGEAPLFMQGGTAESQEEVQGNEVLLQVSDNDLPTRPGAPAILINDGPAGNAVHLEEPGQAHERVGGVIPYRA
jgi:hypothetical protein